MSRKTYWLRPNLLFVQLKEGDIIRSAVIDVEKKVHYTPNETAAHILSFMTADPGVEHQDLKEKIKKKFLEPGTSQPVDDFKANRAIDKVLEFMDAENKPMVTQADFEAPPIDVPDPVPVPYSSDPAIGPGSVVTIGKQNWYKTS